MLNPPTLAPSLITSEDPNDISDNDSYDSSSDLDDDSSNSINTLDKSKYTTRGLSTFECNIPCLIK